MTLKTILLLCIMGYAAGQDNSRNINCQFESSLCHWMNDGNNWLGNWKVSNLNTVIPEKPTKYKTNGICVVLENVESSSEGLIAVRLLSTVVRKSNRISPLKCITFNYLKSGNTKMTLMRREMGLVQLDLIYSVDCIINLLSFSFQT